MLLFSLSLSLSLSLSVCVSVCLCGGMREQYDARVVCARTQVSQPFALTSRKSHSKTRTQAHRHPEIMAGRFAKTAVTRPFTFMSHKDHGVITMAKFFPDGRSMACTATDGSLRVFDLTR